MGLCVSKLQSKSMDCNSCGKTVHTSYVICINCNIVLHKDCVNNTKNYTQCPSCSRIGTLGRRVE